MGLVGFLSVRRGVLSPTGVSEIARLLVDFLLPAGLFLSMFNQYSREKLGYIAMIGAAQFWLLGVGVLSVVILHKLLRVRTGLRVVAALGSLQNNFYLPFPIAIAVLTPDEATRAVFYLGCFVLFFTPVLWTIGVVAVSTHEHRAGDHPAPARGRWIWRRILNPVLLGVIAGVLTKEVFVTLDWTMPRPVLAFCRMCLDGMAPLAMIVLGGVMAEARRSTGLEPRAIAVVALVKLFIVPASAWLVLRHMKGLEPVFAFVVMLEASSPPATNLTLIAKRFGGNATGLAYAQFVTYLLAMLTIPLWLLAPR